KGLADAALAGVQEVVDALFVALEALITGIQALLTVEWNIPFVTDLYQWATTSSGVDAALPLNAVNLFALVLAVPATALYTAIQSSPPFPTTSAVTTATSAVTAAGMLAAAGLTSPSSAASRADVSAVVADPAWTGLVNPELALFFGVCAPCCELAFGFT